jgi:bacterioferritin
MICFLWLLYKDTLRSHSKQKKIVGYIAAKGGIFFINCGKLLTLLRNITMGKQAINVSSVDVRKLLDMLNAALSEEWLAYYQYWIGARLMEGPMRSEVEPELLVHANEELAHAELVANRIIQLGGTPVINPSQWTQLARCPYDEPSDPYIEVILEQNLKGERCAIQRYQEIADFCNGKDHSTHQMAVQILNDELEHENDIEDWLTDLNRMKEEWKKIRL